MPKEILLYGSIDSDSASIFINALNDASDKDISIRIGCDGGEPEYGWGMIAKFAEHTGSKKIKVDGKAYSMGAYFLCYADEVEGLDVSEYLIHRAAYSSWFEQSENYFTPAIKENLNRINASLQKALEAKIDVPSLQAIMDKKPELNGAKVKDIFSLDNRLDIFLSAKEAKQIGLIDKIVKITPTKKAEIEAKMESIITAKYGFKKAASKEQEVKPISKNNIMDLQTLKTDHPALYASVVAIGVAQEKDRAGAWLAFVDVDAEAVAKGIKEGGSLSQTAMAELSRKSFAPKALKDLEKDSSKDLTTEEIEVKAKSAKEVEIASFEKQLDAQLKKK